MKVLDFGLAKVFAAEVMDVHLSNSVLAHCPNCQAVITEKTIVEPPQGGMEVEVNAKAMPLRNRQVVKGGLSRVVRKEIANGQCSIINCH